MSLNTIREVTEITGITVNALRYYDRKGLLHPTVRNSEGRKEWLYDDEADKEQLIRVFEKWANKIPGVVVKSPREDPRKHKGRFVIMDDSGKKGPIVYDELPEWLLR